MFNTTVMKVKYPENSPVLDEVVLVLMPPIRWCTVLATYSAIASSTTIGAVAANTSNIAATGWHVDIEEVNKAVQRVDIEEAVHNWCSAIALESAPQKLDRPSTCVGNQADGVPEAWSPQVSMHANA